MDNRNIAVLIGLLFHGFVPVLVTFLSTRRIPTSPAYSGLCALHQGGLWNAYLCRCLSKLTRLAYKSPIQIGLEVSGERSLAG